MPCPSETELQAFVDGALSDAGIEEMSVHMDTCDDCRTLVGVVQPVPLDDASAVDRVGRYVLRRVLGKGGMGVVYEAVDPELHRVVALKVLRSDLGARQDRLLAEAQSMAKLSHPNVVSIYDVGRSGSRIFIVMALVEGPSLRHWLSREPRSLDTVLGAFEQAAEGLHAAHAAGLVHRDFKPDNVFVARDARVLVGDFGLAIGLDEEARGVEGSVAYMAPEQKNGGKVDARCDQYAFAVALEEAASAAGPVPRWLSRLLARARRDDPEQRYPTMAALLAGVRVARRRARARPWAIGATALAIASIASAALWAHAREAPDVAQCRVREAEMSALWNADVAKTYEQAFAHTNSPLASAAFQRTNAVLMAYVEEWRGAHRRTCEAPAAADPAARALFDRKTSCLTERLEITRAVASSFGHVDAPMLEQVPSMLQLLPRVASCEDAGAIAQLAPPPPKDKSARVEATKRDLAVVAATIAAGHYADGLTLATAAWKVASDVGYLPVIAEAYLAVGTAHGRLGHTREAETALEQAVSSASAGHDGAIAIRAWIQLLHFVGFEGKRFDDGDRYAGYAKAALESMPGAFELEAERLSWSRATLVERKRFDEALVVSRQELALVELRFGKKHRLAAAALDGLAGILAGQCKTRQALEPQERACAILESELGAPHPQVALCLGNLGALQANLGDHEVAMATKARALAMFERVPGHPNHVAMAHRNVVRSLLQLGRLPAAETELSVATAASHGVSEETSVLVLRGELRRREGKRVEALADHARAVDRTKDGESSRRIEPLLALAETELDAGRASEAALDAERATSLATEVYGSSSCRLAEPLRVRADALLATGRVGEALPLAEHAFALASATEGDPLSRARIAHALARALPASDRDRARALAGEAQTIAAASGRDPDLAARLDAWLLATR